MKILKTAEQKNFKVNVANYTEFDLKEMECNGFINRLFANYVVYARDCTDVKVGIIHCCILPLYRPPPFNASA